MRFYRLRDKKVVGVFVRFVRRFTGGNEILVKEELLHGTV
jgi:hypothetical protein